MMFRKTLIIALGLISLGGAARAEEPDLKALAAPVAKLVAALNQGDTTLPAHVFTKDAVVLDDFAPFRWTGKGAAMTWYGGLLGTTPETQAAYKAMHLVMTVEAPHFANVTGDKAYFVIPSTLQFTAGGKRTSQTAQWVFSAEKGKGGWLIASFGYAITGETEIPG
jgi:hypothetical protein